MAKDQDKNLDYATNNVGHEESISGSRITEGTVGLRRVAGKIPYITFFIIITEFCERFAYYGGSAPFTNYVQFPPDLKHQAGALGKGQSTADALKQFFTFFCYVTPLLGAIISDRYLGKYRTIIIFCVIYMCGWLLLTCTSIPKAIEIGAGFPGYILSLIIIGLGTGGIKPLVSPMAADQLRLSKPEIRVVKGEKVIIDPTLTTQHLYNWFYWSINVGALIGGVITPELELHVGFWLAYMVPSCMFAVALMVFVSGSKYYVRIPPSGESTIVKAYHCIRFALKREKGSNPKPRHYLDAAKTNSPEGVRPETDEEKSYKYWDDSFVDGLKQTLMACFIFIPMCIYWTAYNQITSNLISQAASMQLPPSIPDDIIGNIDPIALIIFIPIMDTLVYPFLRRIRMNPRPMMRITIGFALGALAMMTSALVQQRIYNAADRGEPKISVWWQIPSYFLIAMSEIFASITSLEYSYTHAPNSLKGLVMALSLFPNAVAAAIGMALAPVAQNPYLVWNYGGISVATGICGIGFYYAFRHYDDLDDENDAKNMVITEDEIELDKLDD